MDMTRASDRLALAGGLLVTGGVVAAGAAWLHMRELVETYGVICGAGPGLLAHCPACAISVACHAACCALPSAKPAEIAARNARR